LITSRGRASRSKSFMGTFADYSLVPGGRNWADDPAPAPKGVTRPCASRAVRALEAVSGGKCRLTCGEPWTHGVGRADVAPPRLFVDRSMTRCWPALRAGQLEVCALRLGPNGDGVAGRFTLEVSTTIE